MILLFTIHVKPTNAILTALQDENLDELLYAAKSIFPIKNCLLNLFPKSVSLTQRLNINNA